MILNIMNICLESISFFFLLLRRRRGNCFYEILTMISIKHCIFLTDSRLINFTLICFNVMLKLKQQKDAFDGN